MEDSQAPEALAAPAEQGIDLPVKFNEVGQMYQDASSIPPSISAPEQVIPQQAGLPAQTVFSPQSQVPAQNPYSNTPQAANYAVPPQVTQPAQVAPVATPEEQYLKTQQGLTTEQKKSNDAIAEAARQKTQYDVEQQQHLADIAQADLIKQQQHQEERVKAFDTAQSDLKDISDSYQKTLEEKVDPNHFWESKSDGQKVSAGIAIFLGGMAGGFTGKGGNLALDMISKSIDRDIDAQKHNIAASQAGKLHQYDMQQNVIAQMYKRFNNEDQAEAAARMLKLQQVQYQLNAAAGRYQGVEVTQRLKQANQFLDTQQAHLKMEVGNIEIQKQAQAQLMKALNTQGGVDQLTPAQFSMLPKDLQARNVPGYGFARTPEDKKAFQSKRAEVEPLIDQLNTVQGLLQDFNRVTDPKKKEEIQTRIDTIRGRLGAALIGTKRFSSDEIKFVSQALGDPAKYFQFRALTEKRFNTFKNVLQEDLDSAAKQSGLPQKPKQSDIKSFQPR